jgi:hypothetical protein
MRASDYQCAVSVCGTFAWVSDTPLYCPMVTYFPTTFSSSTPDSIACQIQLQVPRVSRSRDTRLTKGYLFAGLI